MRYHVPSSESGGVGSVLVSGRLRAGDGVLVDDIGLGATPLRRLTRDGFGCGSAATTMSEAPENHTRGVGWSSRQLLSNISAIVQLMLRLGGVPTGSANAADSRRHWWADSIAPPSPVPNLGGNENERRNVSMLSTRRFGTKLRGRAGSTCTRWALSGKPCKGGVSVLSDSTEPGGVEII